MAPRQDHLVKIGLEGFDLIDENFGRPRRSKGNPVQKPEPAMISSDKAAEKYGGIAVTDYHISERKPRLIRWP
ncbi:hypothetical protein CJ030_MR5G017206 [Morella rubra]|uniref:Uncharacterized protein n=1 Tax=Morella rubra TaxID=262757 RepID=A0A6A1VMI5_9ROSI|nr:hypothetical protein CJ030_MR5G017206 [Morella rubra]